MKRVLRVRGTREGIYFVLLWSFIVFAGINSGTNLVYLLSSVMASVYFLAFFLNAAMLYGLSLNVHLDREASEEQDFAWEATVQNAGPFARHFVELRPKFQLVSDIEPPRGFERWEWTLSSYWTHLVRTLRHLLGHDDHFGVQGRLLHVPAGQSAQVQLSTRLPARGEYELYAIDLYTSFPMRLMHLSWTYSPAGRVVVVPAMLRPFYTAATAAEIDVETESLVDSHRGEGLDYHGLREYMPGDPPRSIHWKVSARFDRLVVREHQQNRSARYYLFLDLDDRKRLGKGPGCNLEQCVRLAATLCRELVTANCHSQVLLLADEYAPSPSIFTASELGKLMRYLGTLPYTKRGSLAGTLARSAGLLIPDSYVVFVLPAVSDEECQAIGGLLARGYRVSVLLDVADREAARQQRVRDSLGKLSAGGAKVLFYSRATGSLC